MSLLSRKRFIIFRLLRSDFSRIILLLLLTYLEGYQAWNQGWRHNDSKLSPIQQQISSNQSTASSWQSLNNIAPEQFLSVDQLTSSAEVEKETLKVFSQFPRLKLLKWTKTGPTPLTVDQLFQSGLPKLFDASQLNTYSYQIELKGRYLDMIELLTVMGQLPSAFFWQTLSFQITDYPLATINLSWMTLEK